jgi:hypothetical protein
MALPGYTGYGRTFKRQREICGVRLVIWGGKGLELLPIVWNTSRLTMDRNRPVGNNDAVKTNL